MEVEITIKATVDLREYGCNSVTELNDMLTDADSIDIDITSPIDGTLTAGIHISEVTEV